ncbi:MAG: Dam family site-specific DNA-(adenine-N6)-methyltransferase [Chitinophagaceae bacterium]
MPNTKVVIDQPNLFDRYYPPRGQLLKWIGNKQKMAHVITSYFPVDYRTYIEPFLGSGAILATVSPAKGLGSDTFKPLVEIWQTLHENPRKLVKWYTERRNAITSTCTKEQVYKDVLASYNSTPNGADFLFLSRACYGGVIRFRKSDGYMSTPCGAHTPISPKSFEERVNEWFPRIKNTLFRNCDYKESFKAAKKGDLVYCDPPYSFSQTILYGAQSFSLIELFSEIAKAKARGVYVALSIDGNKKSGNLICDLPIPDKLFIREVLVDVGISMLRRFQREGETLDDENVHDRLLLTY